LTNVSREGGHVTRKAVEKFKNDAGLVAVKVVEVKNLDAALDLALKVTKEKEKCPNLIPGAPDPAEGKKSLFLAGLDEEHFLRFAQKGQDLGFYVAKDNPRSFCGGIDTTFSLGRLAIANGGTVIIDPPTEGDRLATMVCEIHVIAIPISNVLMDLSEAEEFLTSALAKDVGAISLITGPSRTSDIERVLTIGAHGPLEEYVALLEEL
jgi:L-lactate dehydrogenase complex protein LldG